jgi:hypothetical protein
MNNLKLVSLVALSLAIGAGSAFAQTAPAAPKAAAPAPAAPKAEPKEEMPSPAVEAYARAFLAKWASDPKLIAAIKESTAKSKKYSYDDVQIIDNEWRIAKSGLEKEKKAASALGELSPDVKIDDHLKKGEALIKEVRGSATSKFLEAQLEKAEPKGAVTEIFVMDGWGWNVGQTGGTSDFYQGDEGKWQQTFASGDPKEVEVLPIVEEDGIKYSQVSLPIKDGGKNIGAVTIGIDVSKVK